MKKFKHAYNVFSLLLHYFQFKVGSLADHTLCVKCEDAALLNSVLALSLSLLSSNALRRRHVAVCFTCDTYLHTNRLASNRLLQECTVFGVSMLSDSCLALCWLHIYVRGQFYLYCLCHEVILM